MRKVTMIIGEPCTGKSGIMWRFIKQPNMVKWVHHPKPFAHLTSERLNTSILGRYDEPHQFPGTDRLSMSIQPVAQKWIDQCTRHYNVLFEGDRLGNLAMAKYLIAHGYDFMCVVIRADPEVLEARRGAERDQPEPFVKGRATKVANIVAGLPPGLVAAWDNNTPTDARKIAAWLWAERT